MYLTWNPMYLCNQTHLIDDITIYVRMKPYPLHVWHHRHFIWHHIQSCWQHTIVCMSWHTPCHPYCVYDYPSSISDLKPVKTAISSTLYDITPSLLKTSHLLCNHHRWHMYAIICIIHDIISTLYDNSPYHSWHHMHYIHYITCIIYEISSTLYDVTFTMCVTSHSDYIYDIKHSMLMTYSLYMESHMVLWPHNHCVPSQPLCLTLHSVCIWHYTQCINFMKRSKCMSSHPLYLWHHTHHIWHHIHSLWHRTTLFMMSSPIYLTSYPLYLISCPLYLCNHTHTLNDITAALCMISHTVYMWHPIHYIYDIISTMYDNTILCVVDTTLGICVTSFELQMISHPLYHTKPQYLWCHMHFRPEITTTVSDITPTVSFSHNLSTNIITTFVWHHTHYMCDILCTLYNIISTPYVITLLYLWHHSLYIWNHIEYAGPHINYTCDITATNLCHHSHSIDNITHTLYDITLG